MINLLPQNEQALIHKEYKLRRVAVCLGFLLFIIVLADVLLFPSFALTLYRNKQSVHASQSTVSEKEMKDREDISKKFKLYSQQLDILEPASKTVDPAHAISVILKDKTSENIIHDISYDAGSGGQFKVVVNGVAKDRQSLVGFATSLRHESEIDSVDLPVSNLAKDTSISFSLTIVGKKNQ